MGKAFEIEYKYKKVEIHIIDFVGNVRNIDGTPDLFSLSYNSNINDKGQYILATEAEINIYEDDFFNIDELKTVGETDILIKYFEHDELVWQGFALPDFFQTGITKPRVLRIVATDRLGVLKDIVNNSISNTPKAIIEECLAQTGLSLPVEIRNNNTYLETTTINRERIEGVSAYDVIRSFMVQFNSKIVQYKNRWWVVNKKLLEDGFFNQEIIDIDLVYLDGQREIKPTASEVSLYLEYGGSQKYPKNWNFESLDKTAKKFDNWTDYAGFEQGYRDREILFYNYIDGYYNAVFSFLGEEGAETENTSLWYRGLWYKNKISDNIFEYPNLRSDFIKVPTQSSRIEISLNGNFTTRDGNPVLIMPIIHNQTTNKFFTYNADGDIVQAGVGSLNLDVSKLDKYVHNPSASTEEGFNFGDLTHEVVDVSWDITNTFDVSSFGNTTDKLEAQIVFISGVYLSGALDLGVDIFINSVQISFNDSQFTGKGLIFKTKQGGDKFSKVRETETTLFSDKINQGVNGYFYNYKYDDTSITNLPKEYLLGMTRQMADMFCSARDFYSLGGKFKVNPLARYRCGNKYFVFVGGVSHRENSEIDIEEIVSNSSLTRTDYIYTYFEDSKDNIKSIGTASGGGGVGGGSGGGGMTSSQLEMLTNLADWWKLDEENDAIYSEKSVYSLKGVSALGLGDDGGGGSGGGVDMLDAWANYTTAKADYYVPASLLVPFRDDTLNRLASLEAGGGAINYLPLTGGTLTGNVTAPTFIGELTGNASSATNSDYLKTSIYSLVTPPPSGAMSLSRITSSSAGSLPTYFNANGVLTINTHPGDYYHQLGFSSDGKLYHRSFNAEVLDNIKTWGRVAYTTDNVASATKLQTARTIAGVSFDGTDNIDIPFANLASKPDTLGGYGITDAYTKAEVNSISDTITTALNTHISNGTANAKHLTDAQLAYLNDLIGWWKVDASGNLYTEKNLYSTKGVSALGLGDSGGGSGSGIDKLDSWANYTEAKADYYVPASFLVPFRSDTLDRLNAIEGGSASAIATTGAGNAITSVSKSENTLIFEKGSTFALSSHTHPNFTRAVAGLVPAPGATTTTRYLREDGTWKTPPNKTYGVATTSASGLMSAGDKSKLDGIEAGANKYVHPTAIYMTSAERTKLAGIATEANKYSLPTASGTTLGGIKVGSRLSISSGTLSANVQSDNNFTNTYKTKLDGIASNANKYVHPSSHSISFITGLQSALNSKATPSDISTAIDGIEIGGRNLITDSTNINILPLYGATATYNSVANSSVPSGVVFTATNITRTIGNFVFFLPILGSSRSRFKVANGERVTVSFYIKTNVTQMLQASGFNLYTEVNTTWKKVQHNFIFSESGNLHYSLIGAGLTSFEVHSIKMERGTKATDWTSAPEDQVSDWSTTDVTSLSYIKNKPTTLAGYGITDAVTLNTAQTITGAKTFSSLLTASAGVTTPKVDFGNGFTIEPSGTELVFKYNGVIKQRMLSNGTILAVGGITALTTN